MSKILKNIKDFISQLDPDSLTALRTISTNKKYRKGEFLLKQGEICKKSFLVLDGFGRKYYLHDGKEITTELYFQYDVAFSMDSYTLQQPSREYIEALRNMEVSVMHYDAFQQVKSKYPKLIQLDLMIVEYYTMWLENRLFQLHTMSATERYVDILEKHPHIIQQIPLKIISSYLGISLETLSRIRAKI